MLIRFARRSSEGGSPRDRRRQMIRQTSAFLTWALAEDRGLPRISTRRVDHGGFAHLMQQSSARVRVEQWWAEVLEGNWGLKTSRQPTDLA